MVECRGHAVVHVDPHWLGGVALAGAETFGVVAWHVPPATERIPDLSNRKLISDYLIEDTRMRTYMSTVFCGARTVETRAEAEKVGTHEVGPFMMLPQRAVVRRTKHQASNRVPQAIVSLSIPFKGKHSCESGTVSSARDIIVRSPRSRFEVSEQVPVAWRISTHMGI